MAVAINNQQTNGGTNALSVTVAAYNPGSGDVVVAVVMWGDGQANTISGTYDGNAMTVDVQRDDDRGDGWQQGVAILSYVPSGVGDVVISSSGALAGIQVNVFNVTGAAAASAEATGNAVDTAGPFTISIASGVTTGALVVYVGSVSSADENTSDVTFSGASELYNVALADGSGSWGGIGWEIATGSSETTNMDHNGTGTESCTMVAASFAPAAGASTPPGHPGIVMAI